MTLIINLNWQAYNLSQGDISVYWALKEKDNLLDEMIALIDLQKEKKLSKNYIPTVIQNNIQQIIDSKYSCMLMANEEIKFILSIYLS